VGKKNKSKAKAPQILADGSIVIHPPLTGDDRAAAHASAPVTTVILNETATVITAPRGRGAGKGGRRNAAAAR
jgi:hypothetical protein